MYMGWYWYICQKWKRTGNLDTNNKNIQPEYRNGIEHWNMCYAHNEKWKKRINRINGIAKSGKHQNS